MKKKMLTQEEKKLFKKIVEVFNLKEAPMYVAQRCGFCDEEKRVLFTCEKLPTGKESRLDYMRIHRKLRRYSFCKKCVLVLWPEPTEREKVALEKLRDSEKLKKKQVRGPGAGRPKGSKNIKKIPLGVRDV